MRNTRLPDRTAGRGAPLPRGALLHARARRRCGAAHAAPGELGSSSALARLVRARLIRARLELGYPSLGDVAVPAADALLGHLAGLRSGEARTRRRRRRLLRRQEGGADPPPPPTWSSPGEALPGLPGLMRVSSASGGGRCGRAGGGRRRGRRRPGPQQARLGRGARSQHQPHYHAGALFDHCVGGLAAAAGQAAAQARPERTPPRRVAATLPRPPPAPAPHTSHGCVCVPHRRRSPIPTRVKSPLRDAPPRRQSDMSPPPRGGGSQRRSDMRRSDQRRSDQRRSDLRGSAVAENHSERYSAENQSAGGRGLQYSDSEGEGEHSERFSAESYFAGERAARGLPLPFSATPLHRSTTPPQASGALARARGSRRAEAAVASPQRSSPPADRLLGRRAARHPRASRCRLGAAARLRPRGTQSTRTSTRRSSTPRARLKPPAGP